MGWNHPGNGECRISFRILSNAGAVLIWVAWRGCRQEEAAPGAHDQGAAGPVDRLLLICVPAAAAAVTPPPRAGNDAAPPDAFHGLVHLFGRMRPGLMRTTASAIKHHRFAIPMMMVVVVMMMMMVAMMMMMMMMMMIVMVMMRRMTMMMTMVKIMMNGDNDEDEDEDGDDDDDDDDDDDGHAVRTGML